MAASRREARWSRCEATSERKKGLDDAAGHALHKLVKDVPR
jgi:hypothetical protein